MACMGMVSLFPDVYNVFLGLKKADKKDCILFYMICIRSNKELEIKWLVFFHLFYSCIIIVVEVKRGDIDGIKISG